MSAFIDSERQTLMASLNRDPSRPLATTELSAAKYFPIFTKRPDYQEPIKQAQFSTMKSFEVHGEDVGAPLGFKLQLYQDLNGT